MSDGLPPIELRGEVQLPALRGDAAMCARVNLSFYHLRSAADFAGVCARLEPGHSFPAPEEVTIPHEAAATGAVFAAVAAIEANLNEFALDVRRRPVGPLGRAEEVQPDQFFIRYRCLGAGCARWAVRSARALIDDFCRRLDLPPPLTKPESWVDQTGVRPA